MDFLNVNSPKYIVADETAIELFLDIPALNLTQVRFVAVSNDIEPHGVELYNRARSEEFGVVGAYAATTNVLPPDIPGFLTALKTIFGGIVEVAKIPNASLIDSAIRHSEWVDVTELIHNAVLVSDISVGQYNDIKATTVAYSIPINLP